MAIKINEDFMCLINGKLPGQLARRCLAARPGWRWQRLSSVRPTAPRKTIHFPR